jgi:hypothetical protein
MPDADPNEQFLLTDDVKLMDALLRIDRAEPAWRVAERAGVDPDYATGALRRMSGVDAFEPNDYPVLHRSDLGPDVYEATEDSSREGRTD